MPDIGTSFGDHVDGSAQKAALTHIKWGDIDINLVYGVNGYRRAAGRQVGTDTEGVVEGRTIHRHGRTAVVSATDRDALQFHTLRGEFQHIVQAAAHRRNRLYRLGIEVYSRTRAVDIHRRIQFGAIDGHFIQLHRGFGQHHIHHRRLRDRSHNLLNNCRVVIDSFDLHRIGSARDDMADGKITLAVGNGIEGRMGRHVDDCHNSIRHRALAIADITGNRGGGGLCRHPGRHT